MRYEMVDKFGLQGTKWFYSEYEMLGTKLLVWEQYDRGPKCQGEK